MPTLGEELKRLREEKGLSIRDVSAATHIGSRFLQAIEADNYSILPGGIFNRGFVRSFARFIGMDEDQALVLYGQQLEAQGGESPRSSALSLEGIEEEVSSPWGSIALIVIIFLLLSAGIYTAYRWFKWGTTSDVAVLATPSPSASLPATEATASPTATAAATSSSSPLTSTPSPSAVTSPSPGAMPNVSPAAPLTGTLQVKVQIGGPDPCWMKVTTDTNPSAMGTLNVGDTREFSANEKMILSLGNAVGVTATLNGRPMNLPRNIKGIGSYVVLTKDNYQQFVQ